jgi:hypothetical protein
MILARFEHAQITTAADRRLLTSEDDCTALAEAKRVPVDRACAIAVAALGGTVKAPRWPRQCASHQASPSAPPREDSGIRVCVCGKWFGRDTRQTSVDRKIVNQSGWPSVA